MKQLKKFNFSNREGLFPVIASECVKKEILVVGYREKLTTCSMSGYL
jgi:phosphoribosyl-AMP cyclohydrolase